MARLMQILFCESVKNGALLKYTNSIDCQKINDQQKTLENNIDLWLSEQH